MMSNTNEPWIACDTGDYADIGCIKFATILGGGALVKVAEVYEHEDARRIVACVNALVGVPTEWLERFTMGNVENVIQQNARLVKQRDELLQELRHIANADTVEWDDPTDFEVWAKNRARAAIEKAEGGK